MTPDSSPVVDSRIWRGIRIESSALASYELPLAAPWRSARGSRTLRRGYLLRLESADGGVGYGECAPLPEAGTETHGQAVAALARLLPGVAGRPAPEILDSLAGSSSLPAARCAVETALLDLAAQAAGCAAARILDPHAADRVAVNAMIGAIDPDIGNRARRALADGYRILKIKLGVLPPEQERAALTALADGLPSGILLRLDANRAWQEDTARAMIDALAPLPIEGLEEPLRRTDFKALRRLQAIAPWPIALDESVVGAALGELLASPPVRRIVLKPMVIGGPLSATGLAARVRAAGLEPVVTTTVDAAVGTCAALHTAAALAGDATHGLATSAWLAEDVAAPPGIEGGHMVVGDRPGLGVTPYDSIRFEETVDV